MTIKDELLLSLMEPLAADGGPALPDDVTLIWLKIVRKFTPLIGPSSVLSMLERSLDGQTTAFPWLPALNTPMQPDSVIEALRTSMTTRESGDMLAAHRAILDSFIDLIATLIGTRLTIQFLRAAFPADAAGSNPDEKSQ